jgi:hypothetical protein
MDWRAIAVTVTLVGLAAYPTSRLTGRIKRRFNVPLLAENYLFQLVGFFVLLGILGAGYAMYNFVRVALEWTLN